MRLHFAKRCTFQSKSVSSVLDCLHVCRTLLQALLCRMVWVGIPVSITGVILIAQPAALFGGASSGGLTAGAVCVGLSQAAFAASHKMCIRYLKGEDSSVQLMYLGENLVRSAASPADACVRADMPSGLLCLPWAYPGTGEPSSCSMA